MAILVIGGHSRNIGKTGAMVSIIAAMPEFAWTAIKITQFGHGVCSANGEPCDCETADHTLAIGEERDPATGTDTSRYLAAGAVRALWVRTRQGQLAEAMPNIRKQIAASPNTIVESNSILRFLRPDLFASVLDPTVADFKPSALRYLDRADAFLVSPEPLSSAQWPAVSRRLFQAIPIFQIAPPTYSSPDFIVFVRAALAKSNKTQSPDGSPADPGRRS